MKSKCQKDNYKNVNGNWTKKKGMEKSKQIKSNKKKQVVNSCKIGLEKIVLISVATTMLYYAPKQYLVLKYI